MNERVKIISRDGLQFVELPIGMTLAEGEWTARRQGAGVVLEPVAPRMSVPSLLALLATLEPLEEGIPDFVDLPPEEPDFAWPEPIAGR
ncbi:AbrB/MazE/SpoVT family DNA-binding domain-containing protein [Aureimonas endophytica]|nr:AbrB/MazE/SpoVT family DNA-binding domain-containing protein [Aureimonas endophytica]